MTTRHRGRATTRRFRVVLAAGVVGLGLVIVGPTAVAQADTGDGGMPPDLGLYCKQATPNDTSGLYSWSTRDAGYTTDADGDPSCTYWQTSGGSRGGAGWAGDTFGEVPAFTLPDTEPGDWDAACRATWGPKAYAQRNTAVPFTSGGGPVMCHQIDYDAYEQAQQEANQPD